MPKKPAWSYTALTSFETCPKKHYHTKVAKDTPDPPGEAALWGQRVHKAMENRIAAGKPLPDTLAGFEVYASKFDNLAGTVLVEQQLCLNRNMQPAEWFGKDAWCRGVIDVAVLHGDRCAVWDWKTGKRKPDNDQLKLFAGFAFIHYPEVKQVDTGFVWLNEKKIDREVFTRDQTYEIWEAFMPRVLRFERAFDENNWPAKPSGLCRGWCPVKSCEHWKPKR